MNRVSTMTKPTGGVTSYSYDATGSLASETDPSGDVTSYVNDLYGRATERTLPNKAVFTYGYDKLGRLEKQTAPQGLFKVYTYDVAGNLTKETDQSDRSTSYTYDVAGRLLTEKNALDLETKYTYDKAGNLASVTAPSGAKTNLDYTKLDQLKTITSPTGRKTELSYDPVGQLTKRTINGKREETYAYDPNGNLEKLVNPLGQSQTKTYDALNRLTAETDTAGQTTLYNYDKDDRLTKVTTGTGATASYAYDGNGNLTQATSGSQRLSSYTYDKEDQLLTATKGSGEKASTSSYTYDSVGNLTSVTNGNGQVTKYSYDQLSNVVERMTALGTVETYTYDVNNQLSKVKKADGKTITYDYNKLDQLLTTKYSQESEGQVLYTYDADGRRVSMSDLTGVTNYVYNEEGEITGVRQGDGSLIQYDYDDYGNIQKLTYPDGSEVTYSYDALDRLTKVVDKDGQVTTYDYNEAGDMTTIKRADGSRSELTYDAGHRVTSISHLDKKKKLISSYAYEYDDGNFITKETISQDGETLVQTYSYDSLGQLATMTISDKDGKELASFSYTYDLAGNRLTSTELRDGKETKSEFSYDVNNRLTQVKTGDKVLTYAYDQNGNRIQSTGKDESLDYIYDTENRLLAVKDKEGMLFAALYDGDDNRVFTASRTQATNTYQLFQRKPKATSPRTSPNGEENSLFWYGFTQNVVQFFSSLGTSQGYDWIDTFDTISVAYHQKVTKDRATKEGLVVNPPDEKNLPGQDPVTYASEVQDVLIPYTTKTDTYNYYEVRNYVNDVNQEHAQVLQIYDDQMQARETYTYGNGRMSYLNNQTGDSYQYLTNQSGSVTGLTKDGQAVASTSYNLYGSTKESSDETGNPFAYNGEARDVTGLDYLRARYYDSQVGTFLTEDSYSGELTDPLSQNLYSYVQNNPVNYTDPSGHRKMGLNVPRRRIINTRNQRKYSQMRVDPALSSHSGIGGGGYYSAANHIRHRVQSSPSYRPPASYYAAFGPHAAVHRPSPSYVGGYYGGGSAGQYTAYQQQQAQARAIAQRQQNIRNAYAQATGIKGTPRSKEAQNLYLNWGSAFAATLRHVCNPKTAKAKDKSAKQPKVSDSFKKDVNKLSYDELKKKYKGLISSQNSYQGTGYGYVVRSPKQLLEDQFVMKRYRELKREADAKQAAHMAELNKYHYLNLYKHIQETGRRPDGTPATDLEKKIAPYVVPIGNLVEAGKGFAVAASAYGAYQTYYGKPILGVDTNWLGKPKVPKTTAPSVAETPATNNSIDGSSNVIKGGFDTWLNKGKNDNSVYFGIDKNTGEAVYTGITKQGIDKRLRQHIQNGKSFSHLDEQLSGLTRNQARAIEQYLIENGDANTLNKINSISPNNIFYDDAKTWAENYINRGY